MPTNRDIIETREPGINYRDKFEKLTVEHFGVVTLGLEQPTDWSQDLPAWTVEPVDRKSFPLINPVTGEAIPGGTGTITRPNGEKIGMDIWRRRVYMEGSQAFIEQLWLPTGGWLRQIRNVADVSIDQSIVNQIKRLADGLDLLTRCASFLVKLKVQGKVFSIEVAKLSFGGHFPWTWIPLL
jgi:hypothetical protein